MPNCKTHDIITAVMTPVVAGVTYYVTKDIKITGIILVLYLFASLMFNGDLDIESRPYNRWLFLKFIWIPYQHMFHHRSVFTHGLVIGTIVRILYLATIPLVILCFKHDLGIIKTISIHLALLVFIGLESGAAVHTIADKIF
jgi:uncharacterized metal-binding protein